MAKINDFDFMDMNALIVERNKLLFARKNCSVKKIIFIQANLDAIEQQLLFIRKARDKFLSDIMLCTVPEDYDQEKIKGRYFIASYNLN